MDNTEAQKQLDNDMDDAFNAAASELGIEMPMKEIENEEGQELQETEEGRQEEGLLKETEPSSDSSELDTESLQTSTDDNQTMPQSWGKKDAKTWESLPPEAKAKVKQRESELFRMMSAKVSEAEGVIAPLRTVLQEVEPLAKEWRARGKTREQAILQAVALYEHIHSTDKLELAKQFLRASGKGPEALVDTPQSSKDRELQELRQKVDRLESGVSEVETERQLAPVKQFVGNVQSEFGAFSGTKNTTGGLRYPSAQNPDFARAMGSLVSRLAAEVPDADPRQLVQVAYERLGGQIDNGTIKPRFSNQNQNNTEKLKTQARSGFGKGKSFTGQKVKYDNADDAWNATLAEFGLLE